MSRKLIVEIIGDTRNLEHKFNQASGTTGRFGSNLGKLTGIAKGAGLALAGGLAVGLEKSIKAAEEHDKVVAQTRAALKSTRGAVKLSAEQLDDYAKSIQNVSGVSRDEIQDTENALLAFTNVSGKAYKRAVQAAVDYSVRTGKSSKTAAVAFGKALSDPEKKLGGLARAGIVFNKTQTDMIKKLAEGGHLAKAQDAILGALETRYGGAGKAAGETFGGQLKRLQLHLRDLEIEIGEKVIPVLLRMVDWVNRHWPEISRDFDEAGRVIKRVFEALRPEIEAFLRVVKGTVEIISGLLHGDFSQAWRGIKDLIGGILDGLAARFHLLVGVFSAIARRLGSAIKDSILAGLRGLADSVTGVFQPIIDWIKKAIGWLKTAFGWISKVVSVASALPSIGSLIHPGGGGRTTTTTPHGAMGMVVPGRGSSDTVPAMLTPGEIVLNRGQQQRLAGMLGRSYGGPSDLFGHIVSFQRGGVARPTDMGWNRTWKTRMREFVERVWSVALPLIPRGHRPPLTLWTRAEMGDAFQAWTNVRGRRGHILARRNRGVVLPEQAASSVLDGPRNRRGIGVDLRDWALDAIVHELVHANQSARTLSARWKAEGGAVDWVGLFGRDLYRRMGIQMRPYGLDPQYNRYGARVWQQLGRPWITRGQFLAGGGIVRGPTLAMLGERGPEAVIPLRGGLGGPLTVQLVVDGRVLAQTVLSDLQVRSRTGSTERTGLFAGKNLGLG